MQGDKERFLGADTWHVRGSADVATNLVDLVDEHEPVARLLQQSLHGRVRPELLACACQQSEQQPRAGLALLGLFPEDVRVDAHRGRAGGERYQDFRGEVRSAADHPEM